MYLCNGAQLERGAVSTLCALAVRCHNLNNLPYNAHSCFGPDGNVQCVIYNVPDCPLGAAIEEQIQRGRARGIGTGLAMYRGRRRLRLKVAKCH